MNTSKIKVDQVTVEYTKSNGSKWLSFGNHRKRKDGECRVVLHDINLRIEAGEFVSILGHSGCGKSTLLKIIAGFFKPAAGEVRIDGRKVDGPRPDHVFVFQEGALFPWLTIGENVAMALRSVADSKERLQQSREYLALVALEGVENDYPHMLSGGMRQRAEIARAMAARPDILFMDEPFSGLDHLTRLHLREEMLYLHIMLPRTTILFVTHDIDEALQLSNRLIILSEPPARVKCCRTIDVPHPRNPASDDLGELRAQIYHHLGVHTAL
ncbi:MAG: ABC transporter ATP-binding protein [Syntrophobacteraceae bacterium]|nr:ABC transporter ATP-binding protein [Syntrophobacteraceae bacterium]